MSCPILNLLFNPEKSIKYRNNAYAAYRLVESIISCKIITFFNGKKL